MSIEGATERNWTGGLRTKDGRAVALEGVAIEGEVLGGHAHVRVRQTYVNLESQAIESVYTFPLPSDATLTGFRMECAGRVVEGVVKEREQAFRAYDDALVAGHGAALLEQERKNVFTASVGNLLPGEKTVIEVEYVQRVQLDEGSMRVMIPTLVAPRYIPGAAAGSRTGHGHANPTTQVPDADRITPVIGAAPYRVTLDLLLDLGREVQVSSPSHRVAVRSEGRGRARVSFARDEEPLDRDIVVEIRGTGTEQLATVCAHKAADGDGYFALSVLPDLFELRSSKRPNDVTFLIDTSGSMDGESIVQARAALRLCLRHLREGDRFNVVAFESSHRSFARESVVFTQKTLERADAWVASLIASGGTELLQPMTEAARNNPHGILVLLTDGQVGNEQEILRSVLAQAKGLRVYSFGIGTNVSDQLLRDLARETAGAVEFIHPGERIEDKVVAQFARAIAPRVGDVSVHFEGLDVGELAPGALAPLVDAEPWVVYGRYERGGVGKAVVRGRVGNEAWVVEVPLDLPERSERPAVAKLWASERIADFERQKLEGRRADAMKARIIELSVAHGVSSQYTSFVVVEKRSGERRAEGGASATRVVPVNAPAGWAMVADLDSDDDELSISQGGRNTNRTSTANPRKKRAAPPPPTGAPRPAPAASVARPAAMAPSPMPQAPRSAGPMAPPPPASMSAPMDAFADDECEEVVESKLYGGAPIQREEAEKSKAKESKPSMLGRVASMLGIGGSSASDARAAAPSTKLAATPEAPATIMGRQLASGLFSESDDRAAVRETALALWKLAQQSVNTTHPMYGTPVKKAVEALLERVKKLASSEQSLAAFALGVAWLVATGRRTRADIESVASGNASCAGRLTDEPSVRAWIESVASTV
ncbi:MAG: VWA domain-containing protein [Myxococcales bacterium]|nr:VWA domain-containing protein [Myxococcales bacterium]